MISSLCSSMIFSENRFPLFRIMLWGEPSARRRRKAQSFRYTQTRAGGRFIQMRSEASVETPGSDLGIGGATEKVNCTNGAPGGGANSLGVRVAIAQQRTEAGIIFDQYQAPLIDAALDQRAGDRPGAGAKLDDGPRGIDIDILGHGARQHPSRRHHGAHVKRFLYP